MIKMRWNLAFVALLVVAMMLVAACGAGDPADTGTDAPDTPAAEPSEPAAPDDVAEGGIIRYGITQEPEMLDAHITSARRDFWVLLNLLDGLTWITDDGEVEPHLAESVTANDDFSQWIIVLRPGVTFHDGTPLNAEAVKYNFDRIVDPDTKSRSAVWMMEGYEGTNIIDDLTLEVSFAQPYPAFRENLSTLPGLMQCPDRMRDLGPDEYMTNPCGTGPFKFVEHVPRERIVLERNPDYDWAPPGVQHSGPPRVDEVHYVVIEETSSRLLAFEGGAIDVMMHVPTTDFQRLNNNPDFTVEAHPIYGLGNVVFQNLERSPTDDLRVRQAMHWITDQQAISDVATFGIAPTHRGGLLSDLDFSFQDLSGMYGYDPERAVELLEEAGWHESDENDFFRMRDGEVLGGTMLGWPNEDRVAMKELWQSEAMDIGVDVRIEVGRGPAFNQKRQSGYHTWFGPTGFHRREDLFRGLLHSSQIDTGFNYNRPSPDQAVDHLIEAAEQTLDFDERMQRYHDVNVEIMEQAWIIPFLQEVQIKGIRSNVHGVYTVAGMEQAYFYEAQID